MMAHATQKKNPKELWVSDKAFLRAIEEIVFAHLDDPHFDTRCAASVTGLSRMHLNRKLKALTGRSTGEFIRVLKLERSAVLLRHKSERISNVARQVGFRSLSHFSKAFRSQYGVTPSQFQKGAIRTPWDSSNDR
jgi:AraC-like DNA-binding protein